MTVVGVSASNSSLSTLESIINGFGVDDVWNEGFLEGECKQIFAYWGLHRSSACGTELEIFILIPRPSLACEVTKSGLSSLVFSYVFP